ncbi:hypothetical protein QTP86_021586 [Hemibagrus guttatus]|nr:hypothetical protein QTP86_021586 [Hemibagrus guttatus]
MFRETATNGDTTDLEEYTSSVSSYISKCIDDVTISKSITTRSNQKLWMAAKSMYPGAVLVVAGDLKAALPGFHKHVKCATRGANILDKVYTNVKLGYRAKPLPHLAQSDHMSLLLIPAYVLLCKTARTSTKTIKTWPDGAYQQLQDCFNRTNWDVFEHQELGVFTDSVLCYIKNCIDTVTADKCIQVYSNQKPWMTREVKRLFRKRNTAFRSGNRAHYSTARDNLKRGIREAKLDYRRRIKDHLDSNNNRQVWQGV